MVRAISPKRRGHAARAQAEADRWNRNYPIGTEVLVREDNGTDTRTTTRSEAYVLCESSAVILLADRSACYALDRVRPASGEKSLQSTLFSTRPVDDSTWAIDAREQCGKAFPGLATVTAIGSGNPMIHLSMPMGLGALKELVDLLVNNGVMEIRS